MRQSQADDYKIGIGKTAELSLRVSVAALARIIFKHPREKKTWITLERTVTMTEAGGKTKFILIAKPFGGGVHLKNPIALQEIIGNFHFDSRRSQDEMDFRLLIRPQDWEIVREFCLEHMIVDDGVLETSAEREIREEFMDALEVSPNFEQYISRRLSLVIENEPSPTISSRSPGVPTMRIYHVSEIKIVDSDLIRTILENTMNITALDLQRSALENARSGGKGRANGVLALPLENLLREYRQNPAPNPDNPILLAGHALDGNVPAILAEVNTTKYQRLQFS